MMIALVTWIAAIIFGLIGILLIMPIRIRIAGWIDMPVDGGFLLAADWALGLVGIRKTTQPLWRFCIFGVSIAEFERPWNDKRQKLDKEKPKPKKNPLAMAGVFKNHRQAVVNSLSRLIRAALPKGYLRGRIGLDDPASTATIALLNRVPHATGGRFEMDISPVYDEDTLQLEAAAQATIIPWYLAMVALILLVKKQNRIVLLNLRNA